MELTRPEQQTVHYSGALVSNRLSFGLEHAAKALFLATVAYSIFSIFFFFLDGMVDDKYRLVVLHVGAAVSFFCYWKFGRWGAGKFDSFGAMLLLVSILFHVFFAIDAVAYGTRIDFIPVTVPLPESVMGLLFKAEAIANLGVLLLVTAWRMVIGKKIDNFSFLNNYHSVEKVIPRAVYLVALFIGFGGNVLSISFGALAQVSVTIYAFGVASIFFIAKRYKKTTVQVMVATGLALPFVLMAAGGGSKESMLFPLVPAAIIYWFGYRGGTPKLLALSLGIVLLGFSQLYVIYVRDTTWGENAGATKSTEDVFSGYRSGLTGDSLYEGLDAISSRLNPTTAHAITVTIADERGIEPVQIFGAIPASLIPRVFWPGKPVLQPGAAHTARIFNVDVRLSEITSATAAGFFTELYLGGWYVGFMVGALLYGVLVGKLQLYAFKSSPGFWHLAFCFMFWYEALRFDEKHIAYAYTSIVFNLIFLLTIVKISKASFRR